MPVVTARELFTRFLDITSPPLTKVLKYLAQKCTDEAEADQIRELMQVRKSNFVILLFVCNLEPLFFFEVFACPISRLQGVHSSKC